MSTQKNDKEKQNASNMNNRQGSGTQYHQEHTNEAMGYGDIDPNAEQLSNTTDNKEH